MEIRAAGGTKAPLMLDWLMWLSMPNVKAEWENPARGNDKHFSVTLAGSSFSHSYAEGIVYVCVCVCVRAPLTNTLTVNSPNILL